MDERGGASSIKLESWGGSRIHLGYLQDGRRLIGRVTRVEDLREGGRTSFEFDAIEAALSRGEVEACLRKGKDAQRFALVRIVSTRKRLFDLCGFEIVVGAWVTLDVTPPARSSRPIAFVAPLTDDGYITHRRGSLGELIFHGGPDEKHLDPGEVGASVPAATQTVSKVREYSRLPISAHMPEDHLRVVLHVSLSNIASVEVHDVGQASMATFWSATGKAAAHFDAGWPISFNDHTSPPAPPSCTSDLVILSHWDWDHLHAYYTAKALQSVIWIVPDQKVGPGAYRIANALNAKGKLRVYAEHEPIETDRVLLLTGIRDTPNDGGLGLVLTLENDRRVLLVGDAGYDKFDPALSELEPIDGLVATHHGALFEGEVPIPSRSERPCIVSVGRGNVYRHPRQTAIDLHKRAGWALQFTAQYDARPRGNRFLK